ncbi:hypothetical protein OQA88_11281 [Cercophora sp. LCS_1]
MTAPFSARGFYPSQQNMMGYRNELIDPKLEAWTVQNYLDNPERAAIINPLISSNNISQGQYHEHSPVAIRPSPYTTQARYGSPTFSNELSSASGTAHSPQADTESYYDHPSTPPDHSTFATAIYDPSWNAHVHEPVFQFMGPEPCVNLKDVNSQQVDVSEGPSNTKFDPNPPRSFSWETFPTPSHCEVETSGFQSNTTEAYFQAPRMASPSEMQNSREQIEARYPPPPTSSPQLSESEEEVKTLPPSPKRKVEQDGDWKPTKRAKTNNRPSVSRPRSRPTIKTEPSPPRRGGRPHLELSQQQLPRTHKAHLACPESNCKQTFPDHDSLNEHTKKKHTRPYTCVFDFAGCESTFASKNEWKRHVSSQHLLLNYWICQEGECSKTRNGTEPLPTNSNVARSGSQRSKPSSSGKDKKNIENGAIFNRKDLYTQHMRRMHMPEDLKAPGNSKKVTSIGNSPAAQQWEERLRHFQDRSIRYRCRLPELMKCPAHGCDSEFHGQEAWDQRMEHVARHLDRAAQGSELPVEFGGERDQSLTQWAGRPDVAIVELVAGQWVLKNGPGGKGRGVGGDKGGTKKVKEKVAEEIVVQEPEDDDEDAECDLDDEI